MEKNSKRAQMLQDKSSSDKMSPPRQKLRLNKETLVSLTGDELTYVAGASWFHCTDGARCGQ